MAVSWKVLLGWFMIVGVSAKLNRCPDPWDSIATNDQHPQREEASLMCILLTSIQVEGVHEPYPPSPFKKVKEELHLSRLKTPDLATLRDLISVDNDSDAEHEANLLREADLQEKILEAVENLKKQIKLYRKMNKHDLSQINHKAEESSDGTSPLNDSDFYGSVEFRPQKTYHQTSFVGTGEGNSIMVDPQHWVY